MVSLTGDEVRYWDENGKELAIEEAEVWDDWDKCAAAPGFPKGLVQFLRDADRGCGFPAPSSIQSYAWPALVTGKDLIGVAKTGSGKTLAFLLPGFMWLKKNRKSSDPVDTSVGPAILALTPTRELCYQIYSDTEKFGTPVKITAAFAYGGAPKWEQEAKFRENPDVLIATPGRLADFLRTRSVSLDMCRYCVLDEADRMLDMGFDHQVKEILDWMPEKRQMSMFTATWPKEVRALADKYIINPIQVQVGSTNLAANADVEQHFEVVNGEDDKKKALEKIISECNGSVLVFCNTKKKVRDLAWEMSDKAVELHGDLQQKQRDVAINQFRDGEKKVLVATDLCARGLDMRSVSVVVNYDAPNNCNEDYVHRIGRTGRAGDKGDSYTFLKWDQQNQAAQILAIMESGGQSAPAALRDLAKGFSTSSDKEETNWWEKKDDSNAEKRIAEDGKPYTWDEFVGCFKDKAQKKWDEAKPAEDDSSKKDDKWEKQEDKWWEKKDESNNSWDEAKKEEKKEDKQPEEVPEASTACDDPATIAAEEGDAAAEADAKMKDSPEGVKRPAEELEAASPPAKVAKVEPAKPAPPTDDEMLALIRDGKALKLTIVQLKQFLTKRGLSEIGLKKVLVERALEAAGQSS